MSTTRPLIIGYLPTEQGEDALRLGIALADVLGATPIVTRVLPWSRELMGPADLERALDAETAEVFALIRDRYRRADLQFRSTADQSAGRALCELAALENAGMIVVGSSHRGAVGRTLLGGVGVSVAQGAPCAVAAAPRGYGRTDPVFVRIGVAFDGSEEAEVALRTAARIAMRTDGSLTALGASDARYWGNPGIYGVIDSGEMAEAEAEAREAAVRRALEGLPGIRAETERLPTGTVGEALAVASESLDLLVCGSRSYGPLRRTLLGSTSAALMSASRCPVLVTPRGAGSDPIGLAEPDDAEANSPSG